MISNWLINDTFNDIFDDDLNKHRAILTQKWMILINSMLCVHLIASFWRVLALVSMYAKRPKGKKSTVRLHFIPKNKKHTIIQYKICWYLVFKISVSVLFKYRTIFQVSVLVSYHYISNSIHPYPLPGLFHHNSLNVQATDMLLKVLIIFTFICFGSLLYF